MTGPLRARLEAARAETDRLFELVKPAFLYARPIAERHRLIFYVGHLEAFDWNLLQPRVSGLVSFDASLDKLFAFGIDPVDGGLPMDAESDWPRPQTVATYRDELRARLDLALESAPEILLQVAIEHRLMHAETLSYLLHQMPFETKVHHERAVLAGTAPAQPSMIAVPSGRATLGRSRKSGFGWDNEFEEHSVAVDAFEIDRYKVTNREYLEFVHAGGYQERGFWEDADWGWKQSQGIDHPSFWISREGAYRYRSMFDTFILPLDAPVYVSHAEAQAYARFAGKRLPTEAEWHRAAYATPEGGERSFPWGEDEAAARHGYMVMQIWDPAPVNAFPMARSPWGVEAMLGQGWEWTSSVFAAFPGFRPFEFYRGYSADFFDGKHFVMKGGSPRTERAMLRRSFRNWFQPHYPYVYAGFRCVRAS